MTGITLLGLGPGNPGYLTREADQWLETVTELIVFDGGHPVLEGLRSRVNIVNLADSTTSKLEDISGRKKTIERVIELGSRPQGVTLALAGHPLMDSTIHAEVIEMAHHQAIPVRVIPGLSQADGVIQAVGLASGRPVALVNAAALAGRHVPPFPPCLPAIIYPLDSADKARRIQVVLGSQYPDDHPLLLVHADLADERRVEKLSLKDLSNCQSLSGFTSLYVTPLSESNAFEYFQEVVARLRAPDGCPWDREQTHASLRQHLLEESYETLEAIDSGNPDELREELGDLLLQIVLNAQIASEVDSFNMAQVIAGINTKIINRHPHVFGDIKVDGVGGVLKNWEKLKEDERKQNNNSKQGLLDGAPASLPALAYSHEIQDRAARVGFDWPGIEGVIAKVHEELEEVLVARTDGERESEIGDLAFAVVNLARWLKVDPESALRNTNLRFKQRFAHIEKTARGRGIPLGDLGFAEMDRLWEEAKDRE